MIDTTIPSSDELVLDTLRRALIALLAECTEAQRAMFERIYPGGVSVLDETKLRTAYELARRTVAKNRRGRD